ncbi:MAG: PH domain-containing protein [Actinomycetota bacterium]|nr:PH domain-containing protein [Actinomycetota bacterium]
MAFPTRLLIDGETLVLDLRPHPVALVLPALYTIALTVVVVLLAGWIDAPWWVWPAVWVVGMLVYAVPKFVSWATSIFAVTSDRVIHREGLIAKRSMEIPLEAINDVRFEQGIFERMVGAGTLLISSASEFGTEPFTDIRHPEEVQRTIYQVGESNKKRMYQGDPAAGGTGASAPSSTSELERLARLRADGVLTEEEFQAQKAKILGQR